MLGRGFVPVRGASPAAARDLELAIAAAQLTGQTTLNVPGLEVVPDIPDVEAMKVFICWAGELSHEVALILRDWLPSVLQHVNPWVSSEDIDKGAQWTVTLGKELGATPFGIVCVVPGNLAEPWLGKPTRLERASELIGSPRPGTGCPPASSVPRMPGGR